MNNNYNQYQLFADRYDLIQLLGRGGFSEVWLAEDTKTNLRVALKIYAPGGGLDDDGVRLFRQEFAMVFELNHTNLLKPTYYDDYNRMPYLVLPYCERGSTESCIGKMTEEEVWKFFRDVASGLAYLHSINPPMIHQDIKPDNIMISNDGMFLITDFGISTRVRSTLRKNADAGFENQGETNATKSSGTLAYMSPERYSRDSRPIPESDVWSLGATAFELMTGRTPYNEFGGVLQLNGAEIPIVYGNYSDELKNLVENCLARDPKDRPTAQEISEYTNEVIHGKFRSLEQRRVDLGMKPAMNKKHDSKKGSKHGNSENNNKSKLWLIMTIIIFIIIGSYAALYYYLKNKNIVDEGLTEKLEKEKPEDTSSIKIPVSLIKEKIEPSSPNVSEKKEEIENPRRSSVTQENKKDKPVKSENEGVVLVEKPSTKNYVDRFDNLVDRIEKLLLKADTPYKVGPLVEAMNLCDSMDYYRRRVSDEVYKRNKNIKIKVERKVDDTYEALIKEAKGFVENAGLDGFEDYESAINDYELALKLKYSEEIEKEVERLEKIVY